MTQPAMRTGERPGARRALAMLALPGALLTVLLVGYVAASGGQVQESELRAALPYIIAVNHTVVFAVLLWLLRREGRDLADIGWTTAGRPLGRELLLGLGLALALYLLKELAFDSVRMLLEGARPTFTSLFRFSLEASEAPMLAVATTYPFVEESVYRGYGLEPLAGRLGAGAGLLIMGFLFGLLHWGNGGLAILFTGIIGIVMGVVFLWRRTLVAVAVAHAAYNAMVLLT